MRAILQCASAFAVMLPCAIAGAQSSTDGRLAGAPPAGVAVGDPVRVWSPGLGRQSGRPAVLAGWTPDSLALLPGGRWRRMETRLEPAAGAAPYAVSTPSVTRLDVRVARGRFEGAGRLGLTGGVFGIIIGGGMAALFGTIGAEESPKGGAIVGGLSGATMGTLVGAAIPGARWRRIL
jgi:hypothetical protein